MTSSVLRATSAAVHQEQQVIYSDLPAEYVTHKSLMMNMQRAACTVVCQSVLQHVEICVFHPDSDMKLSRHVSVK